MSDRVERQIRPSMGDSIDLESVKGKGKCCSNPLQSIGKVVGSVAILTIFAGLTAGISTSEINKVVKVVIIAFSVVVALIAMIVGNCLINRSCCAKKAEKAEKEAEKAEEYEDESHSVSEQGPIRQKMNHSSSEGEEGSLEALEDSERTFVQPQPQALIAGRGQEGVTPGISYSATGDVDVDVDDC